LGKFGERVGEFSSNFLAILFIDKNLWRDVAAIAEAEAMLL
jgi:hypothetical protein